MLVLSYHAFVLPNPYGSLPAPFVGYVVAIRSTAPLFYSLSAFTLALTFSKSESLGAFYCRRFFRIVPLFYLVTIYYLIRYGRQPLALVLENLAFVFNFNPAGMTYHGIAGGAWSIGVEMPFYLVFPLLIGFASNVSRTLRLTGYMLLVSLCFRTLVADAAASQSFTRYGFAAMDAYYDFAWDSWFANLPYFGFGFIAFQCVRLATPAPAALKRTFGALALFGAALAFTSLPQTNDTFLSSPIPVAYMLGFFFTATIFGLAQWPVKPLVNRITIFLGEISFSLYLLHFVVLWYLLPTLVLMYAKIGPIKGYVIATAFLSALSIPLAYLSYRYIEKPGIRLGRSVEKRLFSSAAVIRGTIADQRAEG